MRTPQELRAVAETPGAPLSLTRDEAVMLIELATADVYESVDGKLLVQPNPIASWQRCENCKGSGKEQLDATTMADAAIGKKRWVDSYRPCPMCADSGKPGYTKKTCRTCEVCDKPAIPRKIGSGYEGDLCDGCYQEALDAYGDACNRGDA